MDVLMGAKYKYWHENLCSTDGLCLSIERVKKDRMGFLSNKGSATSL